MVRELLGKYIWIIDALSRHTSLTREEINNMWVRSPLSGGEPIPERTFYHYRRGIEETFNIVIECDRKGRYYLARDKSVNNNSLINLIMDSFAVGNALRDNQLPEGRLEIEDVPSAREFLPAVIDAVANSVKVQFTYSGFNRSRPEAGIIFHPYFLKRYKQRWYMIGMKEKGKSLRTYALDRVKELKITGDKFDMPAALSMEDLFGNTIGVTTSQAPTRTVRLKVTPTQAKYFRALPLHASQMEEVNDTYSIFTYKLKLNYELVHEILSLGDSVEVIEPKELRLMVTNQLKETLALYEKQENK